MRNRFRPIIYRSHEVMADDPRLVRAWEEQTKLRRVLSELLEQIDMLEGYELRRDPVDQYKVDAAWNDAIEQARDAL
jgi:hypothetical protein